MWTVWESAALWQAWGQTKVNVWIRICNGMLHGQTDRRWLDGGQVRQADTLTAMEKGGSLEWGRWWGVVLVVVVLLIGCGRGGSHILRGGRGVELCPYDHMKGLKRRTCSLTGFSEAQDFFILMFCVGNDERVWPKMEQWMVFHSHKQSRWSVSSDSMHRQAYKLSELAQAEEWISDRSSGV